MPPTQQFPLRPLGHSVSTAVVQPVPIPAPVQAFAPDFARRFSAIMAALAALVARRFLREPRLALLIVPLWNRLNRTTRRFERLMAHLAAGTLPKPRAPGRSGGRRSAPHPSAIVLPTGRAWLIRDLGSEAAGYASQLQALLAEAAAAAILALVPAAKRLLKPVERLLGIGAFALRPRPASPTHPASEPLGEVAFRSQGYTWYVVPTPPAKLA